MSRKNKKFSRQDAIYQIALAGISAGVALLMVWLGVVIRFSTIAFFVAGSIAIMVPLTKKYYFSSIVAYAVSAGLSFVVTGDIASVAGYIIYFGPMALITGFCLNHSQKIRWWLALIVKIVYINGALALLFFVFNTIMIDDSIMGEIPYWAVAIVGAIVLVAIDFVLQMVYKRLIPLVASALRKTSKKSKGEAEVVLNDDEDDKPMGDNPFDEFENQPEESAVGQDEIAEESNTDESAE